MFASKEFRISTMKSSIVSISIFQYSSFILFICLFVISRYSHAKAAMNPADEIKLSNIDHDRLGRRCIRLWQST